MRSAVFLATTGAWRKRGCELAADAARKVMLRIFWRAPGVREDGFPHSIFGQAINLCEDFVRIVLVGLLGIPAGEENNRLF
jgi:hypothetical protein